MTPTTFKSKWTQNGNTLLPLSHNTVLNLGLTVETIEFLTVAGLPKGAAPYLSFVQECDRGTLAINKLTAIYDLPESEFEKFVCIGSDVSDNPIVINTNANDSIMWLDHEDFFTSRFVNNSIHQLAHVLILYKEFIERILIENGEDAYLDGEFNDDQFAYFKGKIEEADGNALAAGTFWSEELETLCLNREYYRKQK
jgi:SUKH-4 immunity protein